jgi:hypothetical protein
MLGFYGEDWWLKRVTDKMFAEPTISNLFFEYMLKVMAES